MKKKTQSCQKITCKYHRDGQVSITFGDFNFDFFFFWGTKLPLVPPKGAGVEVSGTNLIEPLNTNLTVQAADIILKKKFPEKFHQIITHKIRKRHKEKYFVIPFLIMMEVSQ